MVRSLWTAATGMNAQQTNVDTIANNMANVNTTGYKAQTAEFKSLLYQELQTVTTTANGDPKPTSSQVGLGVRTASLDGIFTQGSWLDSDKDTAFAIGGDGFFSYHDLNGDPVYTRNGDFTWALGAAENELVLTNSDGNPILNVNGGEIRIQGNYIASRIIVQKDGSMAYPDEDGVPQPFGDEMRIGLWQFQNPGGLERIGGSTFRETRASGEAINEFTDNRVEKSEIVQGYLEGSKVNVATEMVNLIVAQRAYEINSKAITTTDSMMQTANSLKQ